MVQIKLFNTKTNHYESREIIKITDVEPMLKHVLDEKGYKCIDLCNEYTSPRFIIRGVGNFNVIIQCTPKQKEKIMRLFGFNDEDILRIYF